MGMFTKGMGAVLKHIKKSKKVKAKTVHRVKPNLYIKQFKKSKKHNLREKLGVWANREAGKAMTQGASGINVKFRKSGMPYIPKGEKPSMLTKAKGWSKVAAPGIVGGAAKVIHEKLKGKK